MGDRLRAGKPYRYVTSRPGQLSLAIPPWVGAMSINLGWEGNSIGLASHWLCVTDNSGLSTTIRMREMDPEDTRTVPNPGQRPNVLDFFLCMCQSYQV